MSYRKLTGYTSTLKHPFLSSLSFNQPSFGETGSGTTQFLLTSFEVYSTETVLFWLKLWINIDIVTPSTICSKRRKFKSMICKNKFAMIRSNTQMKIRINHITKVLTKYEISVSTFQANRWNPVDFPRIWRSFFKELAVHIEKRSQCLNWYLWHRFYPFWLNIYIGFTQRRYTLLTSPE